MHQEVGCSVEMLLEKRGGVSEALVWGGRWDGLRGKGQRGIN